MTGGRLHLVALACGLFALNSVASAQDAVTTILPPGCQVPAMADARSPCEPQRLMFDFSGMAIVADPNAAVRKMAGVMMGTFGLEGPIAIPRQAGGDDALIALWGSDVTATGSIAPKPQQ